MDRPQLPTKLQTEVRALLDSETFGQNLQQDPRPATANTTSRRHRRRHNNACDEKGFQFKRLMNTVFNTLKFLYYNSPIVQYSLLSLCLIVPRRQLSDERSCSLKLLAFTRGLIIFFPCVIGWNKSYVFKTVPGRESIL